MLFLRSTGPSLLFHGPLSKPTKSIRLTEVHLPALSTALNVPTQEECLLLFVSQHHR